MHGDQLAMVVALLPLVVHNPVHLYLLRVAEAEEEVSSTVSTFVAKNKRTNFVGGVGARLGAALARDDVDLASADRIRVSGRVGALQIAASNSSRVDLVLHWILHFVLGDVVVYSYMI